MDARSLPLYGVTNSWDVRMSSEDTMGGAEQKVLKWKCHYYVYFHLTLS